MCKKSLFLIGAIILKQTFSRLLAVAPLVENLRRKYAFFA